MNTRVLLVGLNFPPEPTGIAPYAGGIAHGLSARGFDVRVITTFPHYPQWRSDSASRAAVRATELKQSTTTRVRHYVPSRPTGVRRALSEVSFGQAASCRGWGSPDLVISLSPGLLSTGMILARSGVKDRRAAVGVVVQDLYSAGVAQVGGYAPALARPVRQLERGVLKRADGVVAIHDRFKRRIVEDLGVPEGDVTIIRNWTHLGSARRGPRPEERRLRGWGEDEFVVLHSGAMGAKQGLQNVVEAARLADARGSRVRFVLVGDGGERPALEIAAREIDRLDVVAPVESAAYLGLLGAADLLLVNERPGVSDMAVPSKLTSYFSSGVAVLAATEAFSTTADEVRVSGAGVVVPPGRADLLLDAVEGLAVDEGHRLGLGANGPSYCANVLSETVALDAYAAWARLLISRRRTGLAPTRAGWANGPGTRSSRSAR